MSIVARTSGTGNDRVPEVYSLREVSRAASVTPGEVRALAEAGVIGMLPSGFLTPSEAVRAIRLLRAGLTSHPRPQLFRRAPSQPPDRRLPLAASGALHAAALFGLAAVTTIGLARPTVSQPLEFKPVRLVFLATPGEGGGGGGGGLKQPAPVRQARLRGESRLRSPAPTAAVRSERPRTAPPRPARPPDPKPVERPAPEPPRLPHADPAPPLLAPVVPVPADPIDQAGVVEPATEHGTRGEGAGGGSGTGSGSGAGEGDGPGLGVGSGGGMGGGPYRPGAGISPPALLHEVRPTYTEEARRRSLEGEVILEIVVRRDGTVSDLRVIRALGGGLERRALDAVRQWRFSPARRHGVPVDVLVEVAVEFRLR